MNCYQLTQYKICVKSGTKPAFSKMKFTLLPGPQSAHHCLCSDTSIDLSYVKVVSIVGSKSGSILLSVRYVTFVSSYSLLSNFSLSAHILLDDTPVQPL